MSKISVLTNQPRSGFIVPLIAEVSRVAHIGAAVDIRQIKVAFALGFTGLVGSSHSRARAFGFPPVTQHNALLGIIHVLRVKNRTVFTQEAELIRFAHVAHQVLKSTGHGHLVALVALQVGAGIEVQHRSLVDHGVGDGAIHLVAVGIHQHDGVGSIVLVPHKFLVELNADGRTHGVEHRLAIGRRGALDIRIDHVGLHSRKLEHIVAAFLSVVVTVEELLCLAVLGNAAVDAQGVEPLVAQLRDVDAQGVVVVPRQSHLAVVAHAECLLHAGAVHIARESEYDGLAGVHVIGVSHVVGRNDCRIVRGELDVGPRHIVAREALRVAVQGHRLRGRGVTRA